MMRMARIPSLILLISACSEHKVEVSNASPVALITSVSDGDSLEAGEHLVAGNVSDPDDRTDKLLATWFVDDRIVCEDEPPTEFGSTVCSIVLSEGEVEIRLQVRDPGDAVGLDSVDVRVGGDDPPDDDPPDDDPPDDDPPDDDPPDDDPPEDPPNTAPTCRITEPGGDSVLRSTEEVLLVGTASDPDQDAHTLTAVWQSDSDGVLGTVSPDTDGDIQLVTGPLSIGLHILRLTVTDEFDEACVASVSVRVGSDPEITITDPTSGTVLVAGESVMLGAIVSDLEDVASDLNVTWEVDGIGTIGVVTPGPTGYASVMTELDVGAHTVTATVTDTHGQTGTDTVSFVVDDVPVVSEVNITPNPAWADTVLTCNWSFSDSGGIDMSTVAWTINALAAGSATTLSGGYVHGDTVACTVTPDDGVFTGLPLTDSLVVSNSLPSVAAVGITPPSPTASDTLTCSYTGYTDLDGEPDHSTLAWRVNGVVAGVGSTLSGVFVRGDEVSCTVTPNDGTDDGVPVSDTVTVGNSLPVVLSASLTPEMVYTNTVVSVISMTTDAEGDPISLSHDWTVDGATRPETGSSLSGDVHFDKHQVVSVSVTPNDGYGDGTPVSGGSVTVLNTPPNPPTLLFIPEAPVEGEDDLWCAVDSPATDLDGDGVSLTFTWSVDGVPWTGPLMSTAESDDTVPLSETVSGQEWTCTVTPHDGEDSGASTSITVTIENAETRVFVTNEATSSDMGGPSGGDDFCTDLAESAGLGGTWVAYLSGGGASAIARIPDGPYVRMDGALIANDKADLTDGSIASPILINQLGSSTYAWVCTGSSEAGTATGPSTASGGNCQGWTRGCGVCDGDHWYAEVGRSERTNDDWSTAGWSFCGSCYLYCFEQ